MLQSNNFFFQTKLYFDKRQKSFSNAKKNVENHEHKLASKGT